MTKVLRMLAGGGFAALLGVVLLGVSGAFSADVASAESPPGRPSRFVGAVTVDGAKVAAGTVIEARIGDASCGVTTTFDQGGQARYSLDVPALDPGASPNCGTDGATVTFLIGGKPAAETGVWHDYQLGQVDLSYTTPTATPETPSPTASPSATPRTGTPGGPVTGSGLAADGGSSNAMLFVVLGLGALAFGVGGAAIAKRSR